ncbi:hypothetical protein BDV33DRAFT_184617 [Aspergillus novoparasiticus]|uniref:Uncharacterized protein n=1 Tax=Aspergillus novoparasiticus TaxID=986946 RepID=A0A5N6E7G7_9EURO|nr:hypothetical protein BDV33DRAFT_184617 [Aspergillus novoparasiticus]
MSGNFQLGLVRTIRPEPGFVGFSIHKNSARDEVKLSTPSRVQPPITIYDEKGPNVTALMQKFTTSYPKIPAEVANRVHQDPRRIRAKYDVISLTQGSLSLKDVPTFIMIRLEESGDGLNMQAIGPDGPENIIWENRDIVEVSGANKLKLIGPGRWIGIGITYEVAEMAG